MCEDIQKTESELLSNVHGEQMSCSSRNCEYLQGEELFTMTMISTKTNTGVVDSPDTQLQ